MKRKKSLKEAIGISGTYVCEILKSGVQQGLGRVARGWGLAEHCGFVGKAG